MIRGYIGDRSAEPVFDGPLGQAFNILGQGYQVGASARLWVCKCVTGATCLLVPVCL